jgi:hypothetical protein
MLTGADREKKTFGPCHVYEALTAFVSGDAPYFAINSSFTVNKKHGMEFRLHTFKFSSMLHLHLNPSFAFSQVLPNFLLHLFHLLFL